MERLFGQFFHDPVAFLVGLLVTIGVGILIDMRLNVLLAALLGTFLAVVTLWLSGAR